MIPVTIIFTLIAIVIAPLLKNKLEAVIMFRSAKNKLEQLDFRIRKAKQRQEKDKAFLAYSEEKLSRAIEILSE